MGTALGEFRNLAVGTLDRQKKIVVTDWVGVNIPKIKF